MKLCCHNRAKKNTRIVLLHTIGMMGILHYYIIYPFHENKNIYGPWLKKYKCTITESKNKYHDIINIVHTSLIKYLIFIVKM